jgi:hypothetical protein
MHEQKRSVVPPLKALLCSPKRGLCDVCRYLWNQLGEILKSKKSRNCGKLVSMVSTSSFSCKFNSFAISEKALAGGKVFADL